jgi:hypothetical protein
MAELLDAARSGTASTSQDLAEGLRSAALAIRCNELIRSPRP